MQYSKQAKTHILSEIAFEVKSARKWKTKEQANSSYCNMVTIVEF